MNDKIAMSAAKEQIVLPDFPFAGRSLSASAVLEYSDCPRKFYYHYIKRLPTADTVALVRGTVIHKAIQDFYDNFRVETGQDVDLNALRLDFYNTMEKYKNAAVEENKAKLAKFDPADVAAALDSIKRMIDIHATQLSWHIGGLMAKGKVPLAKAWASVKPATSEKFYEVLNANGDVCFRGFVDAIRRAKDTGFLPFLETGKMRDDYVIADYKTSTVYDSFHKDDYEFQSAVYGWLFWRATGLVPVRCEIVYLLYGHTCVYPLTLEAVQAVERRVFSVASVIGRTTSEAGYPCNVQEGKFGKHPNCKYCDFEGFCPKG